MANLNQLAVKITLKEGKHQSLSIAQIKEVLKLTLSELKEFSLKDLMELLARIK